MPRIETVEEFRRAVKASTRAYLGNMTTEDVERAVFSQLDEMRESVALSSIGVRQDRWTNTVVLEATAPLAMAIKPLVADAVRSWVESHGAEMLAEAVKSRQSMLVKAFKAHLKDALEDAIAEVGARAARSLAGAWAAETATLAGVPYSVGDAVRQFEAALHSDE